MAAAAKRQSPSPLYHTEQIHLARFGPPIKVPDPSDESGKKKREALCTEVWPGPWSIEHTAEEKIETQLFDGDQAGLDKAVAWLHERYTAEADRWTDIPSILDCEPDR